MSFSASASAPASSQSVRFPDERAKRQPTLSESAATGTTDDGLHNKLQIAVLAGYVLVRWVASWWNNRHKDKPAA